MVATFFLFLTASKVVEPVVVVQGHDRGQLHPEVLAVALGPVEVDLVVRRPVVVLPAGGGVLQRGRPGRGRDAVPVGGFKKRKKKPHEICPVGLSRLPESLVTRYKILYRIKSTMPVHIHMQSLVKKN